mmetsp:Transcript_49457/g.53376  ORF Transcript_49457/g.53376 Transcript_49457/m.53376 type:complete len:80 (-) Transcript_49457:1180-1419(-)
MVVTMSKVGWSLAWYTTIEEKKERVSLLIVHSVRVVDGDGIANKTFDFSSSSVDVSVLFLLAVSLALVFLAGVCDYDSD